MEETAWNWFAAYSHTNNAKQHTPNGTARSERREYRARLLVRTNEMEIWFNELEFHFEYTYMPKRMKKEANYQEN